MNSKLYVGNISFRLDEAKLEELFAQHGTVVSAKIITDRDSGRSRGFGFVEMESNSEAQDAIKGLDGQEVEGRNIRVSIAENRGGSGNRNRGRNFSNRRW